MQSTTLKTAGTAGVAEEAGGASLEAETVLDYSQAAREFVLHWGEMGSRWGINRTVAQVHALLLLSPEPLPADRIATALGVARSNISTSIRELVGWGIVHPVPVLGQRKDHFTTMVDVWEMFQVILDERKKREIDPTLAQLRECIGQAEAELAAAGVNDARRAGHEHALGRLRAMNGLVGDLSDWYTQIRDLPTGAVIRFVKMGSKVVGLLKKTAGGGGRSAKQPGKSRKAG